MRSKGHKYYTTGISEPRPSQGQCHIRSSFGHANDTKLKRMIYTTIRTGDFDVMYGVILTSSNVIEQKIIYLWNRWARPLNIDITDIVDITDIINFNFRNIWPCMALVKVKVKDKGPGHIRSSFGQALIWT